jgi:hypothetical protein
MEPVELPMEPVGGSAAKPRLRPRQKSLIAERYPKGLLEASKGVRFCLQKNAKTAKLFRIGF